MAAGVLRIAVVSTKRDIATCFYIGDFFIATQLLEEHGDLFGEHLNEVALDRTLVVLLAVKYPELCLRLLLRYLFFKHLEDRALAGTEFAVQADDSVIAFALDVIVHRLSHTIMALTFERIDIRRAFVLEDQVVHQTLAPKRASTAWPIASRIRL